MNLFNNQWCILLLSPVFDRGGDWEGSVLVGRRDEEPGKPADRPKLDGGGGDDRRAGLTLARQGELVRVSLDQP